MLHWEAEGAREKRSGAPNRRMQRKSDCTGTSFSYNIQKIKGQAAFTTHWRELSHYDQNNLLSQSALQYLAYLFIICPLAKLFHFWSTWWDSSFLVLILEIREMGGEMLQNTEDVSFLLCSLWLFKKLLRVITATVNWNILRMGMKSTNWSIKWLTREAFLDWKKKSVVWEITMCKNVLY